MCCSIYILHTYKCDLLGSLRVRDKDKKLCSLDVPNCEKYEVLPLTPNMDYHYKLKVRKVI